MSLPTETGVKYDNSCGRVFFMGCIAFVCAFCCIFTSVAGFTGAVTYLALQGSPGIGMVANKICDIDLEHLREAYDQRFTASYKQRVSFTEFRRQYTQNSEAFAGCVSKADNLDVADFLNKEISYSYNQSEITLQFTSKGKRIRLVLYKVGEQWLIDQLVIS